MCALGGLCYTLVIERSFMFEKSQRSSSVQACVCAMLALAAACSSEPSAAPAAASAAPANGTTNPAGSAPSTGAAGASTGAATSAPDTAAASGVPSAMTESGSRDSPVPSAPAAAPMTTPGEAVPAADSGRDSANAWVRFGYDLHNTFFNPAEKTISVDNAASLKELWRFKVAGYPPGSPTVVDGKVYALSTGGIYAIDLNTGMMLWTRDDVIGTSTIAYDNGSLYVHAQGTSRAVAELSKLNAADGSTVWGPVITYDLENCEAFSSAQVAKGVVFVGHSCGARELALDGTNRGPRGGVEAFDAESGERTYTYWSVPEDGEDGAMSWSTVAIDLEESAVYASTGNNYTVGGPNSDAIHKLDFATGMRIWTTQVTTGDIWGLAMGNVGDEDFGASPILVDVGGKKLVAAGDKGARFWAMDRATGEILWSRKMLTPSRGPANGGVLNNGGFDGKGFIFVSNDPDANKSKVYKVDPLTGEDIWVKDYPNMAWGMPSMANGIAAVPINADLYILNAETGTELTKLSTGGTIAGGAAAIAAGKIVVKSGLSYPLSTDVLNSDQIICYGLQ
jgi:hypothetical protein